jgi:hypothetical protein
MARTAYDNGLLDGLITSEMITLSGKTPQQYQEMVQKDLALFLKMAQEGRKAAKTSQVIEHWEQQIDYYKARLFMVRVTCKTHDVRFWQASQRANKEKQL